MVIYTSLLKWWYSTTDDLRSLMLRTYVPTEENGKSIFGSSALLIEDEVDYERMDAEAVFEVCSRRLGQNPLVIFFFFFSGCS